MNALLFILSFLLNGWELAEQAPVIRFKENIQLKNYEVSQSFKLNDKEYILTGEDKIQNIKNEGHRMIYLKHDESSNRFLVEYLSINQGEAYVYNPYFFKFTDNEIIIIAESGFEYMDGIDIYRLNNGKIDFWGHISVCGPNRDSIINQLMIKKKSNEYEFSFTGRVEYKTATDNLIEGDRLSAHYQNNEFKIELK